MNHLKTPEQILAEYTADTQKIRIDIQRIVKGFEQVMQALKEKYKSRAQLIKELD